MRRLIILGLITATTYFAVKSGLESLVEQTQPRMQERQEQILTARS